MLRLAPSGRFKRNIKRGKDLGKMTDVLDMLVAQLALPAIFNDHPLKGDWKGWRDLHIERNWLLIYRIAGERLELAATGTHSDLFNE